MAFCPNFNSFAKFVREIKQSVLIDRDKDKDLRYDVWKTTQEQVADLFKKGIDVLPGGDSNSPHVMSKVESALQRIKESPKSAKEFLTDIIEDENNIEYSIALHEIMESVKGESDKARNLGIEITEISNTGVLPALPLSRVAASIGRKIAFQQGFRFKTDEADPKTAAEIETLYYSLGKKALTELAAEDKGYVILHKNLNTIKDYITVDEMKKDFAKSNEPTDKVLGISLNEDKFGIKAGTPEAAYFVNRTDSDITDTKLGVITDMLGAVRQVTQPATITIPDSKATKTLKELAEGDDPNIAPDKETERVRKKIYDTPIYVHNTVHDLMTLLHDATTNKKSEHYGKSGSKVIKEVFQGHPTLVNSLFGLKRSDDYSVDKKESISGQNLSKTTPLDDLVEHYAILQGGNFDAPAAMHMAMKIGRNARLYYENSVLNPHGSKQSRYMLTAGKYTVDSKGDDFKYLVYGISQALGDKNLTYKDFVGETKSKLDEALVTFKEYETDEELDDKLASLSDLAVMFPGVDYVTILTTLKAVNDIRNPKDGKVTTEFNVSADATASGGTLTFLQALGTKENVTVFLQRIGLLEGGDKENQIDDLYGIMSEAISDFIKGKKIPKLIGQDKTSGGMRTLMEDTVDMLFGKTLEDIRDLSKDPTMTFVYGQKRKGAIETMSRSLADRIVDNLDDPNVRKYLVRLFDDNDYRNVESGKLKDTRGLYPDIVKQLTDKGLPGQLYDIMDAAINKKYLANFKARGNKVNKFVKLLPSEKPFKILPAGAKISGETPTKAKLKKFGMPLTKVMEVMYPTEPGQPDTVLTQRQKLTKTVADVSPIHGIDAAQLYHSLGEVMGKKGVVVVHDDIRGTVQQVRAMEAKYREMTVKIISEYDIHQATMKAIAAQSPEIAERADFIALMDEIQADVDQKKKIMETMFNHDTHALIGDGLAYQEFADTAQKTKTKAAPKTKAKVKKKPTGGGALFANVEGIAPNEELLKFLDQEFIDQFLNKERLDAFVKEINSPIINKYLKSGGELGAHMANMFFLEQDVISISGTDSGITTGDIAKERFLDLADAKDRETQRRIIEHEIIHSFTSGYITKALDPTDKTIDTVAVKDINYLKKPISALKKYMEFVELGRVQPADAYTMGRIEYILSDDSDAVQLSEFIAVMEGEPKAAEGIYEALSKVKHNNTRTKNVIERLIKAVTDFIVGQDKATLDAMVNPEEINAALARTVERGYSFKTQQRDLAIEYQTQFSRDIVESSLKMNKAEAEAAKKDKGKLNYLNYAVASMLSSNLESKGKILAGNLHDIMMEKFPIYTDAANKLAGVYDQSEALQQLVHTITGQGVDKTKKADILAKFAEVMGQQTEVINSQMGKFHKLLSPLSDKEKTTVGHFVTDMPLHDYFVLASEFDTADAIAAEVTKLEKEFKKNPNVIKDVDDLIAWNVLHEETSEGRIYNLETSYPMGESVFGKNVRKLLALKSIQTIGAKEFETLLQNTDLVDLIKDTSVANRLSLIVNEGTTRLTDSMVPEYYKEPFQLKAIEESDLGMYEDGENTGWKILEMPTEDTLGVVYRLTIDSSSIPGAFTDTKLSSTDIALTGKKAEYMGTVKTKDGKKLRISRKNKLKLGLVEDFSQGLVRGTAHSMAIQESQIIRNELLEKETRMIVGENDTKLLDIVNSDNVDNPWFIKLEEGKSFESLDPKIKAKYTKVKGRASNVKSFNENVDLVRKDISHWLLGGSAKSLFTNPQMKWAMRIVKDLIAGAKIGMVVLNPIKIARDNISNVSYLGVMGVSPVEIAKSYKEITVDFQEYSELQRQIIQLKVQLTARPESPKIKKQIKALQDRLSRNSLGDLGQKGFINSLGSDLVARNADTLSGLQADMHTALHYLLTNKKGEKNYVSHFIMQLQNLGYNGEDFLKYIGKFAHVTDSGKGMKKELDQVAERLKEIRTEKDIVNYVSQYTNSPGSEAVRLGSAMTDLTDVLAKETLYRHLVKNEGLSAEAARIKVLDSFPDYKENMPLAVKQLSDVGIIMFPSFWLRIQKVIYRLGRDKPVNLATELMLEEALGSDINTIVDANIINKSNTFGGIFHTPFESTGVGSVIPLHIF